MASLRAGTLPISSRPRDGSRSRRMEGYNDSTADYVPTSSGFRTGRGLAGADEPRTTRLPTKLPSRLPTGSNSSSTSSSSTRRPSFSSSQVPRSTPNNPAQSWGVANSVSGRSGTNPPQSGSSSSSRETPLLRSARPGLQGKRGSTITASESETARNNSRSDSGRTSSSSSNPRSRYSLEPADGLHFDRTLTESPTDLRHARPVEAGRGVRMPAAQSGPPPEHVPELANRYQHFKRPSVSSETSSIDYPYRLTTEDLPPPTPGFLSTTSSQLSGLSASPSTRFSESPGPGPYSRDTTPTSMTSQSPGLVASATGSRVLPPPRGASSNLIGRGSPAQTRPPVSAVTRRRAGSNEVDAVSADPDGLAAVRESQTSSSSNSTVRNGERRDPFHKTPALQHPHSTSTKRLLTKSPSPPQRVSSAKHTITGSRTRDEHDASTASSSSLLRRPGHVRTGSAGATLVSSALSSSGRPLAASSTTTTTRHGPITSAKATPPPRPSRDGTPDIQSQLFEPPRVIHSNLSSAAVAIERRGSEPAVAPSSLPRSLTPSSTSGRFETGATSTGSSSGSSSKYQQLPSSRLATSGRDVNPNSNAPTSTSRSTTTTTTRADSKKKPEPSSTTTTTSRATRTPSPSVQSSFKSSFGFFRRKTAPDVTAAAAAADKEREKKEKALRKGPAAGTGHEGYGRLGAVRRRSSGANNSSTGGLARSGPPAGAVSSSESLISQASSGGSLFTDPFMRDRQNPVVIRGGDGEVVENHNNVSGPTAVRAGSSQSSRYGFGHSRQASNDSKFSSEMSTTSEGAAAASVPRHTLWPSMMPRNLATGTTTTTTRKTRRPSESSAEGDVVPRVARPTLAHRRSMQRLRSSPDAPAMRIPAPIQTGGTSGITSPSYTSLDSNVLSDDSEAPPPASHIAAPADRKGSNMPPPKKLTKPAKSPRSLWPFGRSRSQPVDVPTLSTTKSKKKDALPAAARGKMVAAAAKEDNTKHHPAYYEIMSEQEDSAGAVNVDERVRETLRDAEVYNHPSPMSRPSAEERQRRPSLPDRQPSEERPVAAPGSYGMQGRALSPPQDIGPQFPVRSETPSSRASPAMRSSPVPAAAPQHPPSHPASTPRNRRLKEVGRIPKVVSTRQAMPEPQDQPQPVPEPPQQPQQQASPVSFSRPFNRMSIQMPQRIRSFLPSEKAAGTPPAGGPAKTETTPELTQEGSTVTNGSTRDMSPDITRMREFLSFSDEYTPPRKNSDGATTIATSCSSGEESTGGLYTLAPAAAAAATTAVNVVATYPAVRESLVDEIWPEYNDLVVDDGGGLRPPPSATSSKGMPFALESHVATTAAAKGKKKVTIVDPAEQQQQRRAGENEEDDGSECDECVESPTLSPHKIMPKRSFDQLRTRKNVPVASSIYSVDMTDKLMAEFDEEPESPATPFMARLMAARAERMEQKDKGPQAELEQVVEEEEAVVPIKFSSPQPSREQAPPTSSPPRQQPPRRGSEASRRSNTSTATRSSSDDETTALAQVNLRVGSMTVSKWLTFGHVLFSPAREQLVPVAGSLMRHSILVIDGLGNDDWSFYAAETYPAANFYNLSPRAPLPREAPPPRGSGSGRIRSSTASASSALSTGSASSYPRSPPNHYQIQYPSHAGRFPFGAESFTAVVYRFPAAAPESHYRNIVSEARRVLKPGGHLELSILDVDLNAMGSRGRRQVRRLKERIREGRADTSLGSAADLMLRLLGKSGFGDIKTCRVGVPVASSIARANSARRRDGRQEAEMMRGGAGGIKTERSIAEMMSDESAVADEGIAKMVSRVGRWWYTRCYESAAMPAGMGKAPDESSSSSSSSGLAKKSIWHDASLMRECEEWNTSLKLMVCHARVPDGEIGRGRVASI